MRGATIATLIVAVALLGACGEKAPADARPSTDPISVRGWIADIDTGQTPGVFRTVETEAARRAQNFQSTNVWVENAAYVSGGVAETGAFVLLDVPPGRATVTFTAPGITAGSHVPLENIPGNADVIIPGLILRPNGVGVADPAAIQVRLAANVSKPEPTGATAIVAGIRVPVTRVPINAMIDRRDYPNPPSLLPMAKVK